MAKNQSAQSAVSNGKIPVDQFVKKAIVSLRKDNYKGIHTVFSGFNQAFKEYYGQDPVETTKSLVSQGVIDMHFARGGAMIYLKGEGPKPENTAAKKALAAILG